jgi:acetoin utilization deacetylase AcuC-like enzyme
VPAGSDEDAWLSLLEWIIVPAGIEFRPDLILIAAGYDAHRDDPVGGCALETGTFAEMAGHVRHLGEATGAPVGAVLEGGYDLAALAGSVAATMEGLAGDDGPRSVSPDFATGRAASQIGHFWAL